MDDDKEEKSIIEKMVDKINDAVENIANTASAAAAYAMESNAEKMAGKTNEQVYIPEGTDAAAMPVPLIPMTPRSDPGLALERQQYAEEVAATTAAPKKKRAVQAKVSAKRAPGRAANKTAKKSARKAARKPLTKTSKKSTAGKSGKSAGKRAGRSAAKKSVKKSAGKATRKKAGKSKR
jgi:hypothetical protein